MPERLDRVHISTSRGTLEIPWSSRDALLDRFASLDRARAIRAAFLTVGASRPVQLGRADVAVLVQLIDDWAHHTGAMKLPAGLWDLHNALAADLRADE